MKIIVATPLYPPEIERLSVYTKNLAKYLQKDHQVTVLAYANQIEDDININILTIDKSQPLVIRLFKYTWSLFKLAKDNDIIYVQNAVAAGLPAIIVKYLRNIPVIINFVEDEVWKRAVNLGLSKQSLEEFLEKPKLNRDIRKIKNIQTRVLRRASKISVSSKALARLIYRVYGIAEESIIVNYNPEDREYKLAFETKKNTYQIFARGSLLDWTGIEDIIMAIAKLKEKFEDIKLIISGDGPNRAKLINLAKELDILDNIEFLGKISKAEDWHLLKISQIYIHNFLDFDPADQITQSYLAGTVVIARDTEFNNELIVDNQYGLLFKNKGELVNRIEQIFSDNDLAHELVREASISLAERFSWTAYISRVNNILLKLIKK